MSRSPVYLLLVSAVLVGCSGDTDETENDISLGPTRPADVILTTSYPLRFFTERIVGDAIDVQCVVTDGQEPADWSPDADAISTCQSAGLIVTNGAGLESWVEKTSLPTSRLVNSTMGLKEPLLQYEDTVVHQHGPGGDEAPEGTDPHTWVDPIAAIHQAGEIQKAATRVWPEHKESFRSGYEELVGELQALNERFEELTARADRVHLCSSQQTFNYVRRRYGWKMTSLEVGPDAVLGDVKIREVAERYADNKATVVLCSREPKDRAELEQAGLRVVLFPTLAAGPQGSGDYLTEMNESLDRLSEAIGK